jgi:hypothetical protein
MHCLGSGGVYSKQKVRTVLYPQRVGQGLGDGFNFVPIGVGLTRLSGELGGEGDNAGIGHA